MTACCRVPTALCSYYALVPLTLLPPETYPALGAEALQLCTGGASWQLPPLPPLAWVAQQLSPVQLLGVAVFAGANLLQLHTHKLLAGLATRRGWQYKIPHGGFSAVLVFRCIPLGSTDC